MLVSSEMGLGHLRAMHCFEDYLEIRSVVHGQSIYSGFWARKSWSTVLRLYIFLSNSYRIPLIGSLLFGILSWMLRIKPLSFKRSSRKATFQLWLLEKAISLGACRELDHYHKHQQVITSFYTAVSFYANHRPWVDVVCQVCDTDLSRVWVPRNPKAPNIHYIATCTRAFRRLRSYGVDKENITLGGFPFPHELVGGVDETVAKDNYKNRLNRIRSFRNGGSEADPIHIAYSIGGTGVLANIGMEAAKSLRDKVLANKIIITLIPPPTSGITHDLLGFKETFFPACSNLRVAQTADHREYFRQFARIMANVDVLWTKPGELVFYSALGIPVVMARPIGPQEIANRNYLLSVGAGVDQDDPCKADMWLLNLIRSGQLERMAMAGWERGRRKSLYTTLDVLEMRRSAPRVEECLMLQE